MSCLFNSLSKFVNISPQDLRQQICDFLRRNPSILDDIKVSDVIKWENGLDMQTYINKMEQPSTWGGCLEIKCFCEIYQMAVIIVHKNRKIECIPSSGSYQSIINLNYTGSHYY
jgi:hypothetical protein